MVDLKKSLMHEPDGRTDAQRADAEDLRVAIEYMPPLFVRPVVDPNNPETVKGWRYWSVVSTGDVATDLMIGERYASDAIGFARLIGNADFVSNVLGDLLGQAQEKPGQTLAIEIGFLSRIARLAYVGSSN